MEIEQALSVENKENKFMFLVFCIWTFVLLCRPQDLFPILMPLRPALVTGVLTLAAVQAAVLALQDHQLKNRHTKGIIQVLPPLQLMEGMLFELLWIGVALLTIAIVSGTIFVEDIFAQSLVHKTVLTIAAWLLFSALLWGHYRLGWRSHTAVRLTLLGFVLLMLAFFGSKLVLELILERP